MSDHGITNGYLNHSECDECRAYAKAVWAYGAGGAKQHLWKTIHSELSLCGKAYAGDCGLSVNSRRKKCEFCERIMANPPEASHG